MSVLSMFFVVVLLSCVHTPAPLDFAAPDCSPEAVASRGPSSAPQCAALLSEPRPEELLRNSWRLQKEEERFSMTESDALWASLIGASKVVEARDLGMHPLELIKDPTARRWAGVHRFLDAIPVGGFRLSKSILSDVNKGILKDFTARAEDYIDVAPEVVDRPQWKKMFASLTHRVVPQAGQLRRGAHVRTFLTKSLSEEAFQRLQAQKTELGIAFYEVPGSAPGRRRGFQRQVLAKEIPARLQKLLEDTNQALDAARRGDRADQVLEIVADFHWRFLAIDPYQYGSAETAQAIGNRILADFGYPPSTRLSFEPHDVPSKTDILNGYRNGIEQYVKLVRGSKRQKIAAIADRGLGTRWTAEDYDQFVNAAKIVRDREQGLTPKSLDEVLRLGRQEKPFVLSDDGFLYDPTGTPYAFHEANGKVGLFPIADKTYVLYAMGGRGNGIQGVKRDPSESLREIFNRNMDFVENLLQQKISARQIEIEPYQTVKEANDGSGYHFYEWQLPLLREAIRVQEDPATDPYGVLVPIRGDTFSEAKSGRTVFEQAYFRNTAKVSASDVIGQYELREVESLKLRRAIERGSGVPASERPALIAEIDASRAKYHRAARVILRPILDKLAALRETDRAALETHPDFFGFWRFFNYSKLRYETFEEAVRQLGNDRVVVMRATSGRLVKWLGFRSELDMRHMMELVPASGKVVDFLKDLYVDLMRYRSEGAAPENPALPDSLRRKILAYVDGNQMMADVLNVVATRIFVSSYQFKGTSPELEREYVTQLLHTGASRAGKAGLSTTVSPSLLFKVKTPDQVDGARQDVVKFSKQSDGQIFFMTLPIDHVDIAYSSLWRNQYEVYLRRGYGTIHSNFFVKTENVSTAFLTAPQAELTPDAIDLMSLMEVLPTGLLKEERRR